MYMGTLSNISSGQSVIASFNFLNKVEKRIENYHQYIMDVCNNNVYINTNIDERI